MQHSAGGFPAFVPRPQGSSAIKIVRPGTNVDSDTERPRSAASQVRVRAGTDSSLRSDSTGGGSDVQNGQICRDYMLNGTCTRPDCDFAHPSNYSKNESPSKLANGSTSAGSLSASSIAAPVFIPKNVTPLSPPSTAGNGSIQSYPSSESSIGNVESSYDFSHSVSGVEDSVDHLTGAMQSFNPYDTGSSNLSMMGWYTENSGYSANLNDYFPPPQQPLIQQPLDYHLYTLPLPDSFSHNYFMSDDTREELQKRTEALRYVIPALGTSLPEELQGYHSLVPLEPANPDRRRLGNWFSTVYKAVSEKDGSTYVLRRVENYHLLQQAGLKPIEAWSRIRHPNVIAVQEGFTTRNFGDNSLVVAYAYHPNSRTLADLYLKAPSSSTASTPTSSTPPLVAGARPAFKPKPGQIGGFAQPRYSNRVPERTLWSYIVQIANATKAIHDAGMPVRILEASKILVTGKNRVRMSSCGLIDVLMHDVHPIPDVHVLQHEDLVAFGRLIIALCCANPHADTNLQKAMEIIGRHYSVDVKNIILFLISKPTPHKNISQLFDMLGSRLLTEMDEMQNSVDRLEGELMSELENGRLVRLLVKFGFINERPEFARDARWSETGDRYVLKLFRDYVFHQTDENGNPLTSLAHVLGCLSKLDAGSEERILLIARDEQSCVVATFKEIKAIAESAFRELSVRGGQTTS